MFAGFCLLGGGGREAFQPKHFISSPKFFLKKIKLFQILVLFDDDIKEPVKATNVQKCNFTQS